jgi:hypothetical protein
MRRTLRVSLHSTPSLDASGFTHLLLENTFGLKIDLRLNLNCSLLSQSRRGVFLSVEIWWKSDATFALLHVVLPETQTMTLICNLSGSQILLSTNMIA